MAKKNEVKKEVIPQGHAKYQIREDCVIGKKKFKKDSHIVCLPIVADYLKKLNKI